MDVLPGYYVVSVIAVLGLIIGSFLDVIVSRFHTGKSINGRSRCMSCGHTLSFYELFPVFSYLALQGRCKNCESKIPVRLFLMEVVTAFLFVYVYIYSLSFFLLCMGLVLVSTLLVIAVYDMKHMVIPHEFVFVMLGIALVVLFYSMGFSFNPGIFLSHIISAVCSSFFFGSLWFVSKGRWIGLGDAKLAFPLALMLQPIEAFSFVVLSFWIGAGISLVLLALQWVLQSGKHHLRILSVPLTIKSEVPFAPFMILAFIIVFFQQVNVTATLVHFF